jgi:anti-sigma-K factor RskA
VVVLPDGTAYVRPQDLPAPGAGRDLQLWSVTPSGPVSAGLLHGTGWRSFTAAPGATAFAVTDEPRGGSQAPTSTPLVSGEVAPA